MSYSHTHAHGTLTLNILKELQIYIPSGGVSVETGCGKSTILFSNLSSSHTVFAYDDRNCGNKSSVNYFMDCPYTWHDNIEVVYGATQRTLPTYKFSQKIDCVLIDGPHGYPFSEIEYYFLYPHIANGGLLIIDDINIPTVNHVWQILKEDDMFEEVCVIEEKTGILRRTDSKMFDPFGDSWWEQKYNRYRVPADNPYYLDR